MDPGGTAAMLMGIGPAMLYLYVIWGKFESVFNERRVLFNFVLGLISSAPLSAFYLVGRYSLAGAFDLSIIFAVLFALAWSLLLFALSRRWWRREGHNALMYSVSFSLGVGATLSTFLSGYEYRQYGSPLTMISFIPYALAIPLLLAASGAEISAIRDRMGGAMKRGLPPTLLLFLLLCPYFWSMPVETQFIAGLLALTAGVMYVRFVMTQITDSLPQEVRRKWRRERRKGR
jgi:hypothetical protein